MTNIDVASAAKLGARLGFHVYPLNKINLSAIKVNVTDNLWFFFDLKQEAQGERAYYVKLTKVERDIKTFFFMTVPSAVQIKDRLKEFIEYAQKMTNHLGNRKRLLQTHTVLDLKNQNIFKVELKQNGARGLLVAIKCKNVCMSFSRDHLEFVYDSLCRTVNAKDKHVIKDQLNLPEKVVVIDDQGQQQFYVDVGINNQGIYMKISHTPANNCVNNSILISYYLWAKMGRLFADAVQLVKTATKTKSLPPTVLIKDTPNCYLECTLARSSQTHRFYIYIFQKDTRRSLGLNFDHSVWAQMAKIFYGYNEDQAIAECYRLMGTKYWIPKTPNVK
ncbi:protein ORF81 [Lake sturgeon herpesvirus]|nr:protein ORF81 [Lake sturgeon herpesvirus]